MPKPPLIQKEHLTYQGAFRLPGGRTLEESFAYGGTALAYYPANDSLLLVGHDWHQNVAEVSIPRLTNGRPLLNEYVIGTFRQPFADVLEGKINQIGGPSKVGGLLVWGDALIVTAFVYYDASGSQTLSHFRSSLDLARTRDLIGPFKVGTAPAGFVSGYMTPIPEEWQAALGGPAFTGQCCLPIIGRTSLGPAVSVFDPADVGVKNPVPATQVLGYPIVHPTLGRCDSSRVLFNCTSGAASAVFPKGTRSVLFFGTLGTGTYCYGTGGPSRGVCFDPINPYQGPHAYPYLFHVWAYDVLDLIAVKQGKKEPWEVVPYTTWTFELPFTSTEAGSIMRGAAYDPKTERLFLAAARSSAEAPLIYVFTIGV